MKRAVHFSVVLVLIAALVCPDFVLAQTTDLVTDTKFNPNDIISDDDLLDTAMTVEEIQTLLNRAGGKLKDYNEPSAPSGEARTAAQIIWQAAQDAKINPEIILAMLQKEQSLLEDPNPSQYQFDWAMGYSKCDGCAGVPAYRGFGNQVRAAAMRLRYFYDQPEEFNYQVGKISTTNDKFLVAPQNLATRGLYVYNPYRGGARLNERFVGANFNFYKIWNRLFAFKATPNTLVRERESDAYYLIGDLDRRPFVASEAAEALYAAADRERAERIPRRKLVRAYPALGSPITLSDIYAATLVDAELPTLWAQKDARLRFRYKNLGSKVWQRGDVIVMLTDPAGAPLPEEHEAWVTPTVGLSFQEDTVRPGELATFTFPIFSRNPFATEAVVKLLGRSEQVVAQPSEATLGMVATASAQEIPQKISYSHPVSGSGISRVLDFQSPYQAVVESFEAPATLAPATVEKVKLAIRNTGDVSWDKMNIRLSAFDARDPGGSVLDHLNPKAKFELIKVGKKTVKKRTAPPTPPPVSAIWHPRWRDRYRVALMNEKTVGPTETATFSFPIRTPSKEGKFATVFRLEFVELEKPNTEHRLRIAGEPNYLWTLEGKRPAPKPKARKKKRQ